MLSNFNPQYRIRNALIKRIKCMQAGIFFHTFKMVLKIPDIVGLSFSASRVRVSRSDMTFMFTCLSEEGDKRGV